MLTVKLVKYDETPPTIPVPTKTDAYSIREAASLHVRYEKDGRTVVQLGDAPGETQEFTIGSYRADTAYSVAYVMNHTGRTIDKIT